MRNIIATVFLFGIIWLSFSCNDGGESDSSKVTSIPSSKVFSYYPWDYNNELSDDITQEFEIFNRGDVELKIMKINLLDPDGKPISEITDSNYKKLFQIQIQKTSGGIAKEGWNGKLLSFDNISAKEGSDINSFCPLNASDLKSGKCREGFSSDKYNSKIKILLSYSKDAAEELKNNPQSGLKNHGDFYIEFCTNDSLKQKTATCPDDSTSYKIRVTRQPNKPPKPVIKVLFEYTVGGAMSYRNIKDIVSMNLKNTCVSDPEKPESSRTCLANWEEKYYIKYKWEMTESPTPLINYSQLELPDSGGRSGQWLSDFGYDDPKKAKFSGLKITPVKSYDKNKDFDEAKCLDFCGNEEPSDTEDEFYPENVSNYLICRQKYCEKFKTKYYKVNIQAETVDKQTDLVSDTAEVTVLPKIIPQARVVAQLTWDKGYKTMTESQSDKDGVKIDLDIHIIKKTSLEAPTYGYKPLEGVLGTYELPASEVEYFDPTNPEDSKYFRHDDCSFMDNGISYQGNKTIAWHASLDIDNTWGGNNFETPETIGLGPIEDKDGNGIPEDSIMDDQYLVVVGYVYCTSQYEDGINRCDKAYAGEDAAYEVNARLQIFVDGDEVPRAGSGDRPADNYSANTKDFKIKHGEWKVVSVIKWDTSLPSPETNPKYPGDAIISDVAMTDEGIETDASAYKICNFSFTDAILVPIWDETAYYDFVNAKRDPEDENSPTIGECY